MGESIVFGKILTKIKQSVFVQKGLSLFFGLKFQERQQRDSTLEQQEFFFEYLGGLQDTLYWSQYGFDYQNLGRFEEIYHQRKCHIPIWNHDTMGSLMFQEHGTWSEFSLKKRRYAMSGGTTNLASTNKKYIYMPYDLDTIHQSAFQIIAAHVIHYFGVNNLFTTNFLPLGGSIREETDAYKAADVSAHLILSQNVLLAKTIYPYSVDFLVSSWEEKYKELVTNLHSKNIGSIMGTTKRVAMMLREIYEKYPDRWIELEKSLQCILRGGVDIAPYQHIFQKLGIQNLMGIYNAAEGMIGFQDLNIQEGIWYQFLETGFFEFIPRSCIKEGNIYDKDLPCFWMGTLTPDVLDKYGQDYLLLYSTPGQIRSPMDVLRLQYFGNQLRFQIVGRVGGFINLTGEELLESHARYAIRELSKKLGIVIEQWTVAPNVNNDGHEWIIEYSGQYDGDDIITFLDSVLQQVNGDYADKRGCGWLCKPTLHIVANGTFDAFHASRGKIGGQTKCLVMSAKREYIEAILRYFTI